MQMNFHYTIGAMLALFSLSMTPTCTSSVFRFPLVPDIKEVQRVALLETSTSWDGGAFIYPSNNKTPTITANRITIPPQTALAFHCHPSPIIGYISAGQLTVETLIGESTILHAGDAVIETQGRWHRGITQEQGVVIIGFDLGVEGSSNTILMTENNQDMCRR